MTRLLTTEIGLDNCPSCGAPMECASSFSAKSPKKGDYSVCFRCFAFLQFGEAMKLRLLTIEDIAGLNDEERIELVRMRKLCEAGRLRADIREAMKHGN